jgi:ribosomal protein L29
MPSEVAAAVLRAELDQVKSDLAQARITIAVQKTESADELKLMQKDITHLLTRDASMHGLPGGNGDGRFANLSEKVANNSDTIEKNQDGILAALKDLTTKYWKLAAAVSSLGAGSGAAFKYLF